MKTIITLSIMFLFCFSAFATEDEQLRTLLEKYVPFIQRGDIVQITAAPTPTHKVNVMPDQQAWSGKSITIWGNSNTTDPTAAYEWDFDISDANPVDKTGAVTDNHYIKADYTYNLPVGVTNLTYTAMLTIKEGGVPVGSDQVNITVIDKTSLTPDEQLKIDVNIAIENGLEFLYLRQRDDGAWAGNGYLEGPTGYVALAFLNQGYRAVDPGNDPAGITDREIYAEYVYAGLKYLFTHTRKQTLSPQPYGDPDPEGLGGYYYLTAGTDRRIYETGMVLMAIASTGSPGEWVTVSPTDPAYENLSGKTYKEVAEGVVRYFAWAQNEAGGGRGGWRYVPNSGDSDNSNAQWPVIGMQSAERLFGVAIPPFVKSELNIWIQAIQKPPTGAVDDGGSGYTWYDEWDNTAKTGALIAQMEFVGDTRNSPRVLNAMDFIEKHWNDTKDENNQYWELKNGNYYAVYSVFKGLFAISATPGAFPWDELPGGLNWRKDLDQYLVSQQRADGSWPNDQLFDTTLATAAAVLSLMRTIVGAPFVTVNSIDSTDFPTVTLNIFVDSDAGVSGGLEQGDFEILENQMPADIIDFSFDDNTDSYNLYYTSPNPNEDGSSREVLVRVTDPEKGVGFKIVSYTAPLSGVIVEAPDVTAKRGQRIIIPVNLSYVPPGPVEAAGDIEHLSITSVQFKLKFDKNFLIATRLITEGTATESWGKPLFHISSGEVEVSMAGADPLTDSGALAKIEFDVWPTAPLERRTELDLVYVELNEGNVGAEVFDGVFYLESCTIGDVTGDGKITPVDARWILEYVAGKISIPDPEMPCFTLETADVSNNGAITALDAHLILSYIVGVITEFPRK